MTVPIRYEGLHTSLETGNHYFVWTNGTDRWYYDQQTGAKLVLPYFPNTAHGRYYFDQISNGMTRRQWRRFHDDYMITANTPNYRPIR